MASRAPEGAPPVQTGSAVLLFSRLPSWAGAADFFVLVLIILAPIVAMSGGVRTSFGDWRLTITSPYRLMAWAATIAALRHAFVRQQPIHRHVPATLRRWTSSPAFRAAATAFVATRLVIFLVGFLAVAVIGFPPGAPPPEFRNSETALVNLPLRWDAGWYLQIARSGYRYSDRIGDTGQQNIVFFPALPVATRIVALFLGGGRYAYVAAGTLVSLAAFFFALVYVYLIARRRLSDEKSRAALWLLGSFPFAYFYGAIYTESIFLLGAAGAFYHAEQRQLVRAAAWGLLVGLTKPNGFLVSVALTVVALTPFLPPGLVQAAHPVDDRVLRQPPPKGAVPALVMAMMPIVGTLMFSGFLWRLTGSPLAWVYGHAAWGRRYTGLGVLLTDRYHWISNEGFMGYLSKNPYDFLNAVGVVFVLATLWPVARRLGLAYAVLIVMHLVPPLAQGGLLSAGRLASVLFPAFIWFASAVPVGHRSGWILAFAALQALNASLFYTWRPLF